MKPKGQTNRKIGTQNYGPNVARRWKPGRRKLELNFSSVLVDRNGVFVLNFLRLRYRPFGLYKFTREG